MKKYMIPAISIIKFEQDEKIMVAQSAGGVSLESILANDENALKINLTS